MTSWLFTCVLTAIYAGMMSFFIRGALRLGRVRHARIDVDSGSKDSGEWENVTEEFATKLPPALHSAADLKAGTRLPESLVAHEISGPAGFQSSGSVPTMEKKGPGQPRLSVSVIVPLRNEEKHAAATLESLAKQDYQGDWEVICVDDRSQDATAEIIQRYCRRDPRFRMVNIPVTALTVTSPKKRALAAGFSAARGEILMTTDADCLAPSGWIRSMALRFDDDIGIVQGPKRITGDGSLISRYQEHEVFGLVSIEAATFAMGRPMIASAPSLAYRKELYESVGGFQGLEETVSGDDDMLVRKMQKNPKWRVGYNPSRAACVSTSPVTDWKALILQRARWASNGAHYDEKGFVALLSAVYAFYWWLVISPCLAALGFISWGTFLFAAGAKLLLSAVFLGITSRRLRHQGLFRDLVWCEALHVPIVLIAVILGHLGLYRWK